VEVLHGDRWKAIPTEVIRGKEYVPLDQVAAVTDGSVQRANGRFLLRLPKGVLALTENIPRIQVGSREVALAAPPVLQGGQVWVPLEVLTIAMGERYGEERVFWDEVRRVLWVGSTEHTLRLVRYRTYPEYTRIVWETTRPLEFVLREDETRTLGADRASQAEDDAAFVLPEHLDGARKNEDGQKEQHHRGNRKHRRPPP